MIHLRFFLENLKMRNNQYIVTTIIVLNTIVFLAQEVGLDYRFEGALWRPDMPTYHIWQWITYQFLHSSVSHILFNMVSLGMFGGVVVQLWVWWRFVLLYVLSGLMGALFFLPFMTEQTMLLGASGAIFGVLSAFAVIFPRASVSLMFLPFSFPAKYFVSAMVLYEAFAQISGISLLGDNIAHMAHVGGAITGVSLAWYWQFIDKRKNDAAK